MIASLHFHYPISRGVECLCAEFRHYLSPNMETTADAKKIIMRITKTEDYYVILNVQKDATEAQIKKEFRLLARVIHPDKCSLPGAEDAFKKVFKF